MTHRKKWTPQQKLNIAQQDMSGNVKVSELCNKHRITQAMYYEWKNLLLMQGARLFERRGLDHKCEHLEKENRKLKESIGELHVEQKNRMVAKTRLKRRQSQFYLDLLPEVEMLKGVHPAWDVRRGSTYLRKCVSGKVNHKGMALLMKNNGLTVPRDLKLRAKRAPKTRKPVTDIPDTVWGTDMTKNRTAQGWACMHVVLDWGSKKLLVLEASLTSHSSEWIRDLNKAVNMQFPNDIDRKAPYLPVPSIVSDNGCQPMSKAYADYERALGLEHVFTCDCNPKGNADSKRVIRTVKEDLLWINDYRNLEELEERLRKWQHDYNHVFPHSSLENCTPMEYEERWHKGTDHSTQGTRKSCERNP